jgi:hypothetical protein
MPRAPRVAAAMTGTSQTPETLVMHIDGLPSRAAQVMAHRAAEVARRHAPKLSGRMARNMHAVYGPGYFGVHWEQSYLWFQEHGARPFTMTKLAGKTIPMWIDDPRGTMRRDNPNAKTRRTESGRTQVLIFRRAARAGARKMVRRNGVLISVPASYPGAPGRIAGRYGPEGRRQTGGVRRFNVGVRWRFPGLAPRNFVHHGIETAAREAGFSAHIPVTPI